MSRPAAMTGHVDAVALFGTAEEPPARRLLRAGPLSAIIEDGNLRTIRHGDIEIVRAINYLARDSAWGTYKAALSNIAIEEQGGAFSVAYDGLCAGPEGRFAYRMTIKGEASGRLTMEAVGEALTDFPTNRTGFVVLHAAEAAGGRLTIRHSDGQVEETVFPEAISPDQPAFDIAALIHEPAPGLVCTVEMQGDAFEMEDQRNWADASFKTYVRPLTKPRPYTIAKGERDVQKIAVVVSGIETGVDFASADARDPVPLVGRGRRGGPSASPSSGVSDTPSQSPATAAVPSAATLTISNSVGKMPSLALFVEPDDLAPAIANAASLGPAQSVIVRFDPARGHDSGTLAQAAGFAAFLGATLSIEAVFDARDPSAEAAVVAKAVKSAQVEPEAILVAPRRDFRSRPSNTLPAGEQPIADVVAALKVAGVPGKIGAGTPSFFTEFNRNPPTGDCDFAFFSIAANVHAADDVSVMETLSAYPAIVASARKLCPGKRLWLGPCTIAMRHNPYAASVAPNLERVRQPAVGSDPRHGALFGAAFATGVAAQAASVGVDRLILAAPTGPHGLLDDTGKPRPIRHVHAILAAAAGAERLGATTSTPDLATVAFRNGALARVLVANLSPEPVRLRLPVTPSAASLIGAAALGPLPAETAVLMIEPYRALVFDLPATTEKA